MRAADMIEILDTAIVAHGTPQVPCADNETEFITTASGYWASEHDTLQAFIPPSQHWLGAFVESFHNRMRNELLEDDMFEDIDRARTLITVWPRRYNEERPTARWADSHPTNTNANGPNATNNNQQPSKHPVRKTRPSQRPHHIPHGKRVAKSYTFRKGISRWKPAKP